MNLTFAEVKVMIEARGDSAGQKLRLDGYRERVEETRAKFRTSLSVMSSPCSTLAAEAYSQRIESAHNKLLLGEYSPWLFSEILSCDPHRTSAVAVAWMHVYLSILIIDDAFDSIDIGERDRAIKVIISELLVQRGLALLGNILEPEDLKKLQPKLSLALEETASAALSELANHRDKVAAFDRDSMNQVRRKLSMLKLCAAGVAAASSSWGKLEDLSPFIKAISLGFQLLDDLSDICEDWNSRSYTLPLTIAIQKGYLIIKGDDDRLVSRPEILGALIGSGALEECASSAKSALRRAIRHLKLMGSMDACGALFLVDLCESCNGLLREVRKIRKSSPIQPGWVDEKAILIIDERLKKIAQSS